MTYQPNEEEREYDLAMRIATSNMTSSLGFGLPEVQSEPLTRDQKNDRAIDGFFTAQSEQARLLGLR